MFRKGGVKKKDRGSYSSEIRYNYDAYNDTWLTPIDGDGNAFTGGTWDVSELITEDDQSMYLQLVGTGVDEDSSVGTTALSIGFSYLSSRAHVLDDTNLAAEDAPAKFSVLNDLLTPTMINVTSRDNIVAEGRDAQDNPPL